MKQLKTSQTIATGKNNNNLKTLITDNYFPYFINFSSRFTKLYAIVLEKSKLYEKICYR